MEADGLGLEQALALAAGGGAGLSPEKRAALGASLLLLRRDYRFQRVRFWGRLQGLRAAYYIADGRATDLAAPPQRLYRCVGRWAGLPEASPGDVFFPT